MDYSKGKIYLIVDTSCGDLYVGSTIQDLHTRFRTHGFFKDYNKQKSNCKISLIEDYPCNSRRELEKREQYWIDKVNCINKTDAFMDIEKRRKNIRECNSKRRVELRPYKAEWKRNKDIYRKTWGGDERYHNNLLLIDVNLFL